MQNFNPEELMQRASDAIKRVEDFILRAEQIEQQVYDTVEKMHLIISILSPFLPAPLGTALEELPELQDQVVKVKTFINDVLPLVNNLVGVAGVGATQKSGVTVDESELKPAAPSVEETRHVDAQRVGNFRPDKT